MRTYTVRPAIKWAVIAIWIGTAVSVVVLSKIHIASPIDASLHVRRVSFVTSSTTLLEPNNFKQIVVSGVEKIALPNDGVTFQDPLDTDKPRNTIEFRGGQSTTCLFSPARIGSIGLPDKSIVTILWPIHADKSAVTIQTHGIVNGTIAILPNLASNAGMSCTNLSINGSNGREIIANFSAQNSVEFETSLDSQVSLKGDEHTQLEETQIPILGVLRFSRIDPLPFAQEKTVLLAPSPGLRNEIVFQNVSKKLSIDDSDILEIVPDRDFYIRRFRADSGIQLSLHGMAKDVLVGAGPKDLKSQMPSLLDSLGTQKRIYGVIPGVVAFIIGLLEKWGMLHK